MRKIYFTMLALFFAVVAAWGQASKGEFSGSFSGKAKYASGKNNYLLDEYKVDYLYKIVMGEPICVANMTWTRNPGYTVNKKNKKYAQLSEYEDLKLCYDLIVPKKATYKYTLMFYSEQSKAYIASATTSITLDLIEKAGSVVSPEIPMNLSWKEDFSNVVLGKQDIAKPGVVIADATLEEAFKAARLASGKLNSTERGYSFRLRRIFDMATRIDVVNVTADFAWNDADYNYISDEHDRRVKMASLLAAKDTAKANAAYFDNRTSAPTISKNSVNFWNSTVIPCELWISLLNEAEKLYEQKNWEGSRVYYQQVADAAPELNYPKERLQKIQKYLEMKTIRNVGDLELIYVEGSNGIKSFYMGKMEITQRQWMRVMRNNPSKFKGRGLPVDNISWDDAQAFIAELNKQTGMKYRLPRAEEWAYAAKGGVKSRNTQYSGSNNLDEVAWCAYNSSEATHPVAEKSPNELGLYDMTGNLCEWVVDQYDKVTRFVKGGSWADDAVNSVISESEKFPAKFKSDRIGFRVCQDE